MGLEGAARERFQQIEADLAEASTHYSNNLLDATKAYSLVLTRPEEIDGLPPSLLAAAAQSARGTGETSMAGATAEQGPWRITLEAPLLIPFMEHSRRRDLREQLYRAHITRASSGARRQPAAAAADPAPAPRAGRAAGLRQLRRDEPGAEDGPQGGAVEKLLASCAGPAARAPSTTWPS